MKNFVQPGDVITAIAPVAGVVSGQPVLVQDLFGVATGDAASGGEYELAVKGVFALPKAAVEIAPGELAFFDDAAGVVTNVAAGGVEVGHFTRAALTGAPTAEVRIR